MAGEYKDFKEQFDDAFGDLYEEEKPKEGSHEAKVLEAFGKLPWYKKLGKLSEDTQNVIVSGLTYGGADRILDALGLEPMQDSRLRMGPAAIPTELISGVASPITRGIGAGAAALKPLGSGIMQALTRGGVNALEGGAIGATDAVIRGNTDNIGEQATTSAAISTAVPVLGKIAGLGRYISGILADKDPALFTKAFQAGKDPVLSEAFRAGQKAKPAIAEPFKSNKQGFINLQPLKDIHAEIKKQHLTAQGTFKGTPAQQRAYEKMLKLFEGRKGINAEEADALRLQLGDFAKNKDEVIAGIAKKYQAGWTDSIKKNTPEYPTKVVKSDAIKEAEFAGKGLSRKLPPGIGVAASVGPFLAGMLTAGSPIGAATLPLLPLASPRLAGLLANKAGNISGMLEKAKIPPAAIGILAQLQQQERQRRREK